MASADYSTDFANSTTAFESLRQLDRQVDWAGLCEESHADIEAKLRQRLKAEREDDLGWALPCLGLGGGFMAAVIVAFNDWGDITGVTIGQSMNGNGPGGWVAVAMFLGLLVGLGGLLCFAGIVGTIGGLWNRMFRHRRRLPEPVVPAAVTYEVTSTVNDEGQVVAHIARRAPALGFVRYGTAAAKGAKIALGADESAEELSARFDAVLAKVRSLQEQAAEERQRGLARAGLNEDGLTSFRAGLEWRLESMRLQHTANLSMAKSLTERARELRSSDRLTTG